MRTVNIGVVGCGEVARRIYLPEFHRLHDKAALVAVCDRVEERAKAAQQRFGARRTTPICDRFLRESDAEIVVNLTPHKAHVPVSMAALEAGRHVYTEKAMAQSVDDATQLIEVGAAASRQTRLCPGHAVVADRSSRWQQLAPRGDDRSRDLRTRAAPVPRRSGTISPGPCVVLRGGQWTADGCGGVCAHGPHGSLRSGLAGQRHGQDHHERARHRQMVPPPADAFARKWLTPYTSISTSDSFFAVVDVSWCVQTSRNEPFEVYGEHGTLSGDPTYANTPIHIFRPESRLER